MSIQTYLKKVEGFIATPYYENGSFVNAPTAVTKIEESVVYLKVSSDV